MHYHLYLHIKLNSDSFEELLWFDYTKDQLLRIANQINKNDFFWAGGKKWHPSKLNQVFIYKSRLKSINILMPNGSDPLKCKFSYVVKNFNEYKVRGVEECSPEFIFVQHDQSLLKIDRNPLENKNIFIVHGTDHKPVEELKDILTIAGFNPMILEELPGGSKTLVEKLEKYSNVAFAFVILTPDDIALGKYEWLSCLRRYFKKMDASVDEIKEKLNHLEVTQTAALDQQYNELHKDRARQNVILEFGYFIGKLGRERVCYLVKGKVETPSDMDGIAYHQFLDSLKEIEQKILRELKESGLIKTCT